MTRPHYPQVIHRFDLKPDCGWTTIAESADFSVVKTATAPASFVADA